MATAQSALGVVTKWLGELSHHTDSPTVSSLISAIGNCHIQYPASVKSWLARHDGARVDTYQFKVRGDAVAELWTPGPRTLDIHSRATYALFDGSRRDYAGLVKVAASDSVLVVWNDDWQTLIVWTVA